MVFDGLRNTGLKANLKKCNFGSPTVAYLGFQLTPEGVLPGKARGSPQLSLPYFRALSKAIFGAGQFLQSTFL
jgi:hypothetical protein